MDKIASPQELQDELVRVQALLVRQKMARGPIAAILRHLAFRVAGEVTAFDRASLDDLELFMENEGKIHNQKKSIIDNIKRKMKKGQYDPNLAPKLWMYWVESGAKEYIKQHASPGTRMPDLFPKSLRMALAEKLAKEYEKAIKDGEYGDI